MPEDRSLDEFAVDAGDASASEVDDAIAEGEPEDDATAADTPEAATAAPDANDVDPAVPTATWTTDAAPCDRCGERVERRWLDDGALVCAACKAW